MKRKRRGISLIVLIVTIIVIIILAAAVILTLSKNNPIESAREAKFKEDIRSFQDELSLTIAKRYADNAGHWNDTINASSYNDIKDVIPSFTKEYEGMFVVDNNELKYTKRLNGNQREYVDDLNIKSLTYLLPYEYQQVEYIESTGTQYIDTGITPDLTYGFYIDFYFDVDIDIASPSVKLLGSSKSNGGFWGGVVLGSFKQTDGGLFTWFASGTPASNNLKFINPRLVSKQRMNCYCINNIYKTSNEETTYNFNKEGLNNIYENIYLFAINLNDGVRKSGSNLKIYEYKAYKNSEVIQDLIPCYRESDGVAGMYDIIKGEFFINQGEGSFEVGADI